MTSRSSEPESLLARAVAEEVRVEMARKRISGNRLAKTTKLSQSSLSLRLRGEYPLNLDELEVICEVLEISPVEVLRRAEASIDLSTRLDPDYSEVSDPAAYDLAAKREERDIAPDELPHEP